MKIGSVFVLASLVFLSAALEPVFEFRPADGKPYHAGDLPEDLPRLRFPEEKFSGEQFTVEAWVAPGGVVPGTFQFIGNNGYRGIVFKGNRGRMNVDFSFQLYDMVPNFSLVNPDTKIWEGILRYHDKLRTGKYGTELVPLKECVKAEPFRWNHVAAAFDKGKITTYVNGKIAACGTSRTRSLPISDSAVQIGCGQGDGGGSMAFFNGYIGSVSFYDTALSQEQIAENFQAGKIVYPDGRVEVPRRRAALFSGYSPDFRRKLALTERFERNIPAPLQEKNSKFEVVMHNGAPAIRHNGEIVPCMTVAVAPRDSDEKTNASLRDFAAAGMPFQGLLMQNMTIWRNGIYGWFLAPGKYDFSRIDTVIQAAVRANPRARIMLRLKLDMPRGWAKLHRREAGCTVDGKTDRDQPSFSSPAWRRDAMEAMQAAIRHIESSSYAHHIAGYLLSGGRASEWYWWGSHHGLVDYSPVNREAFREYLKKRYRTDAALRKAWNRSDVSFGTAEIPSPEQRSKVSEYGFFRYWPKARAVIDYRMFASDTVADCISMFAAGAKQAMKTPKLIGVFYGYTLWHRELENQGFHALNRILRDPNVDFLIGPTSYDRRRAGQEGDYLCGYTASLRLHRKFYVDEADMRTCFAVNNNVYRTPTLEETLDVHWRSFGNSLTQGAGIQWLLLEGVSTFHHEKLMEQFAGMARLEKSLLDQPRHSVAEVALIVDETSMMFVNDAKKQHQDYVRNAKAECGHAGFPFDTYLFSDLFEDNMPDYKLYIFANVWHLGLDEYEVLRKIHARLSRNRASALWFYAPGFITYGGNSLKLMNRLTGFEFRLERPVRRARLEVAAPAGMSKYMKPDPEYYTFDPGFSVVSPDAVIHGRLRNLPVLAEIRGPWGGKSFYSLTRPTADLLRGVAEAAGVHIWNRSGDLVRANAGFLMIHADGNGRKEVRLPGKRRLKNLADGTVLPAVDRLSLDMRHGETVIYQMNPPAASGL